MPDQDPIDRPRRRHRPLEWSAQQLQTVIQTRMPRSCPVRLVDTDLRKKPSKSRAGLDELQREVGQRIKSKEEVETNIVSLWQVAETDVAERWNTDMLALAPGDEILAGVWQHFGLSGYSKVSDGQLIASKMTAGPAELLTILEQFIAD